MRSSEKWGVDVDTAVGLALAELKLGRDEVEVEVLEESSSGFLGIGSKLAKVRVTAKESGSAPKEKATFDDIDAILASLPENSTVEMPEEIRKDYDRFEKEEREDAHARKEARAKERKAEKNREKSKSRKHKDVSLEDKALENVKKLDIAENHPVEAFLADMTEKMGIDLGFTVRADEELVYVEISGKDTGTIIGKRGQTLDAVQCLASYVVNKDSDKYIRVVVDAENYRSKREKTLVNLANRLAGKVARTGRKVTLEPMNPYERKIIHSTLQSYQGVKTRSEGKEPYRKVIIEHE